ncbi:S-layer homology domain-containing protein [Synechococcus sp. Nb3U1]|uniref:S-layer homology domain-containing protein n=1 Tax=Synechococcus sp. Nb3U1 TaxID=1914529 RepID=UPI001F4206AD|nr:S-layer homology domain-containing protein [Synechococcus sp. Nb3U1]MCF2971557.1 S-layer homology domain-containing protein [Synechococcus sp. Nb3U1]
MSHHQPRSYPTGLSACLKLSGVVWLLFGVSACQGTEWGDQLGRWVQPVGSPALSTDVRADVRSTETPATPRPQLSPGSSPTSVPAPVAPRIPIAPSPPIEGSGRFVDLETGSLVARSVNLLDQLGVFADLTGDEFQPQRSIRRGEFARWLVLANNAIYADEPSRQIRLGSASERPIFLDVPEEDPHFRYIQALGAAGLIDGDAHQEFRPNSLLSRAELIRMKVPLDLPPGQVKGSLPELEEGWGFTDAAQVPPEAIAPLVADRRQNNASTVLRTFGPIRTFNPFEPVSRGEAAIALSAFGERTAQEALSQLLPLPDPTPESEPKSEPSPPTPELEQTASPEPEPSPDPTPESEPSPEPTEAAEPTSPSPPDVAPGEFVTPTEPQP